MAVVALGIFLAPETVAAAQPQAMPSLKPVRSTVAAPLAAGPTIGPAVISQPVVLVLPAVSNGAYGGYVTATYLQNTGRVAANVAVQYFDQNGGSVGAGDSVTIASKGTAIIRQDNGNSFATGGAGSALVHSDEPLAGFVNEFAPGGATDATSYSAIPYVTGGLPTLYAPAIASAAYGGYTTGIGLINLGFMPATITISYRNSLGGLVETQVLSNVLGGAYRGVYSGNSGSATDANLPAGFAGTATITTSGTGAALAAIVNETGPGNQFSSYDTVPISGTGGTLFAPVALRNASGGYNTGMGIQNAFNAPGTVTITYYDASGQSTLRTFTIAPFGYLGIYQGTNIPVDGSYTAVISTPDVSLAAIVNEVAASSTSEQQSTSYNTFATGAATVYLPLVESTGPDNWSTGEGIMNTGSAPTTVTVSYYDATTGAAVGTSQTFNNLPVNAFWGVYQPTSGLPSGTKATALITNSSGGQVSVVTNEASSSTFMSYDGVGG